MEDIHHTKRLRRLSLDFSAASASVRWQTKHEDCPADDQRSLTNRTVHTRNSLYERVMAQLVDEEMNKAELFLNANWKAFSGRSLGHDFLVIVAQTSDNFPASETFLTAIVHLHTGLFLRHRYRPYPIMATEIWRSLCTIPYKRTCVNTFHEQIVPFFMLTFRCFHIWVSSAS